MTNEGRAKVDTLFSRMDEADIKGGRSERQLMEQTRYTNNRQRLIEHEAVVAFFNEVIHAAHQRHWLSGEHFSVDGMLIQAWAGHKSIVNKNAGGAGIKKPKRRTDSRY